MKVYQLMALLQDMPAGAEICVKYQKSTLKLNESSADLPETADNYFYLDAYTNKNSY